MTSPPETPRFLRGARFCGEIPPASGTAERRAWVWVALLGLGFPVVLWLVLSWLFPFGEWR
jgi:hypothetical protein